jgi:DNA primase
MVSVIGEYVRLERAGSIWKGLCPFHNEKTPSFTVNPDKKLYYCFGCNKGGDIINFVREMDKLSFVEAIELLAKKAGVPIIRTSGGVGDDRAAKWKEDMAELFRRVSGTFQHFLLQRAEGRGALAYTRERGISEEIIERFRLGYAPADGRWLFDFLRKKGYSAEFLATSTLFSKKSPEYAFFRNRLMFPINDRYGKTAAFGGRILPPNEGPKYINSAESPVYSKGSTLFAIDLAQTEIRARKEAIICEGYMDVMAMHQAGLKNAVAPLGTAFTNEQARLLGRWARCVLLLFDADTAGMNAAVKAVLTCRRNNLECRIISMAGMHNGGNVQAASYKDPADILKDEGAEMLTHLVQNSILDIDFLIARSKTALTNSGGMANAVAFMFPFLETVDSEVSKDSYIKRIAEEYNTAPQAVKDDFLAYRARELRGSGKGRDSLEFNKTRQRVIQMNDELTLLTMIFAYCDKKPELFLRLRSALPIEEFNNQEAKELYLVFEESLRSGQFSTETILAGIKDETLKNYIVSKSASDEFAAQPETMIAEGIQRMEVKRLRQKRSALITEMRIAKNSGQSLDDLLSEKMFIDEKLLELEQ